MSDQEKDLETGHDEGTAGLSDGEAELSPGGTEGGEAVPSRRAVVTKWHVREGGMQYFLASVATVTDFLKKRESFDGIEVSIDDGESWVSVWEIPELASVEPATPKKRAQATPEPAAAHQPAATSTPAQRNTPSPQTKKGPASSESGPAADMKKRMMALGAVLVVSVIALAVYYVSQSEPSIPNTPAGQQAAWVIEQLNTDGSGLTANALRGRYAAEVEDGIDFEQLSRQLQGVARTQHSVRYTGTARQDGDHAIDVRITNDAQTDGVITVQVSAGDGRITAMSILSGAQYASRRP